MKKRTKLLLAAATLWPFVYLIFFFLFIFGSILFLPQAGTNSGVPAAFMLIFVLHALTMLLIMALTVFYIVDIFRNERVQKDQKVLWAVVIFLGNMIAMPIYWYLYIWKEPAVASHSMPGQLNSVDSSAWTSDVRSSQREEQYVPPPRPPDWR